MWICLCFLFHFQTLRLEVMGMERCSSMRSPAAARDILVHPCMSLQIVTTSARDREQGAPVWSAAWWQGGDSAKACPCCAMLQLGELKGGWEKSLHGNLRCRTRFSYQKSGRSRPFVVVNVQAVGSPDVTVISPCLGSIFRP